MFIVCMKLQFPYMDNFNLSIFTAHHVSRTVSVIFLFHASYILYSFNFNIVILIIILVILIQS